MGWVCRRRRRGRILLDMIDPHSGLNTLACSSRAISPKMGPRVLSSCRFPTDRLVVLSFPNRSESPNRAASGCAEHVLYACMALASPSTASSHCRCEQDLGVAGNSFTDVHKASISYIWSTRQFVEFRT